MNLKNFRNLNPEEILHLTHSLIESGYAVQEQDVLNRLSSITFEYYPTSHEGSQFTTEEYLALRRTVLEICADAQEQEQFDPSLKITDKSRSKFDSALTENSLSLFPMSLYEAGSEEIWTYISLVVLPDVANWRFTNKNQFDCYERHVGKKRNVFRRLWIRMYFTGGEAKFASTLTEDQAVSIFERADTADSPRLAKAFVKATLTIRKLSKDNDVYRDAMKRVTRMLSTKSLDLYSDDELEKSILQEFRASLKAITGV